MSEVLTAGRTFVGVDDLSRFISHGKQLSESEAVARYSGARPQPLESFLARKLAEFDIGQTPTGPGDGGVQSLERLVGGDENEGLKSLAGYAVGEVEQTAKGVAGFLTRS